MTTTMTTTADDRFEERVRDLEADIASVCGVLNAAAGRLVELVADALDGELWNGWGIHSATHWLGWQAGMSRSRAAGLVKLAERRAELPSAVAALVAGELSADAAVAIARRAPAAYEASITDQAKVLTIGQLGKVLAGYHYDDETEEARPKPREDERSVSSGVDDVGWWGTIRLPAEEGQVVEQAWKAAQEDLYEAERADTPEGQAPRPVTLADAVVGVAESFLRSGEAAHPGSDRYQVLLHLEAPAGDPADGPGILSGHLGPPLPDAARRLLLCDCTLTPVWEREGTPISLGRKARALSRRLRRVVEHRDQGCRVPGCGRQRGIHLHHIVHWEDGGATDTGNPTSCQAALHWSSVDLRFH
ncbi:HNH endonuclease [Aquihabitans sp. G128]|uniref:HNH endonuclease signature motif containing protein n=1 Tax=Aquihabitans sp. G128 TaxID=2849779 RepID=UPI001C230721|nr:HNH endonuclease signature motif containing protein [Aquihabitans sp. G128]QXC59111.1 HNH endonuclease [Aquihabitans sp. G128]